MMVLKKVAAALSLSGMLVILTGSIAGAAFQCYDCHGTRKETPDYRPLDGAYRNISTGAVIGSHRTHMAPGATPASCEPCHPGSSGYKNSHMDRRVKISANINASPASARYRNTTSSFPRTATPARGTCSSVNCHFEAETPVWGSAALTSPAGCSRCHGAPPADGSHPAAAGSGKKHGDYYGAGTGSCSRCHTDHQAEAAPFAHATSVGKRALRVVFQTSPNSGGTYSGSTAYPDYLPSRSVSRSGTCSVYCHSNGAPFDKPQSYSAPQWGGSAPCGSCHGKTGATAGLSGRHDKHAGGAYSFACSRCHNAVAEAVGTIKDTALHVNGTKDVAFSEGGTYAALKSCNGTYCHSDGRGNAPRQPVKWSDTKQMACYSCHLGRSADSTAANCDTVSGTWNPTTTICSVYLHMTSNGHNKLVSPLGIRKYSCNNCHFATANATGVIVNTSKHLNGVRDVAIDPKWNIVGRPAPSYNATSKVCDNVYCHSDGTSDPEKVRPFEWTRKGSHCNDCHGHPRGSCADAGCHDGRTDPNGIVWKVKTGWAPGEDWKGATPMFPNQGAGTARANSHSRHIDTTFTCDKCHAATIKAGACSECHTTLTGTMSEGSHLDGAYHVNKSRDVVFKDGGTYNPVTKSCSNTACHLGGSDPVWGGSVKSAVTCLNCHGTSAADADDFGSFNGAQAKINLTEWVTTGHGRPTSAGPYPVSGNPAANFPGNPCWYCHDNTIYHKDLKNPFRLRIHQQFERRFEAECVYCHMEGTTAECLSCHDHAESLAPQLGSEDVKAHHGGTVYTSSCRNVACHDTDDRLHKAGAGFWNADQKEDVRNQYLMMGVCLQCHDDDSGGKCDGCHSTASNPLKYRLGFDPGSGFIKPQRARASSVHFGYKHWRGYQQGNVWKGGKFCWDCHDPHGDANIYMVQAKVATTTDGRYGVPQSRSAVSFVKKQSGMDYVKTAAPYDGICNVCHSASSKHFRNNGGDSHNISRICTNCHEHRFTDSHANGKGCAACHRNKPVPRHSAFGQPRDCVKCHAGTINKRMDVMGQMRGVSHHVQGVEVSNTHCYACHWESTSEGLIDVRYHEGYNYKTYTSVKNAPVDLVLWEPGKRPSAYRLLSTAVRFTASNMGTAAERQEAQTVTNHCISCHRDENNDIQPFADCKTPRQYAWDRQSIASRYSQKGTTTWGKYVGTSGAAPKNLKKAFSAHGNAIDNEGGFSPTDGLDGAITSTRKGTANVQCFDCHSSHGSKLNGTTTSYVTFNGTRTGGNLKETQAGKGGYSMSYKASSNASGPNPYGAGAGQCFDCHMTRDAGTTPWGFQSTFGATAPIMGYLDGEKFGTAAAGRSSRYTYKPKTVKGGHLKASSPLQADSARTSINGLCTPCHDPHGVSPTLAADQPYAVPLLKGTWVTSPYPEDAGARADSYYYNGGAYADAVYGIVGNPTESDARFGGLCLRCHSKSTLTDGTKKNGAWKSIDRIHESVKGWGDNSMHNFTCSKCHAPHVSGLPRLMVTNCLDYKHRGGMVSGGDPGSGSGIREGSNGPGGGSFPKGTGQYQVNCHPTGSWPDNSWNSKTPW